jgi:hypothetical protein
MKRILFLFGLLLVSVLGMAQAPSNYTNINGRYRWIAGMFDSTFHIPKGTTPSLRTGGSTNAGGLFYNTADSSVYTYTGTQWIKLRGVVIDTTSLSNRINLKLNISDTSSMLTNYFRINGVGLNRAGQTVLADTLLLSTRAWRQKGIDSVTSLITSGYVPYTGATTNVDLGTHTLTAYNLIINHSSGSGVAASITKGGNGEALTVSKTSGSGNAMSVSGGLTSLVDLSLSSVANATTDTDRFLVSDGGVVKYRTGTELLSDIGGASASSISGTTNYIPKFTSSSAIGNSQIFDNGTNVGIGVASNLTGFSLVTNGNAAFGNGWGTSGATLEIKPSSTSTNGATLEVSYWGVSGGYGPMIFKTNNAEQMRLTSTGLGIGTSSPASKLSVGGDGYSGRAITAISNATAYAVTIRQDATNGSGLQIFHNTTSWGNGTPLVIATSSADLMRLDASGNLGLGVTPSAWSSGEAAIQTTYGTFIGNSGVNIGANAYYNAGWKYVGNAASSLYAQASGQHQWFYAASGTAGNAITFTQAMTLDASGNLVVGGTTAGGLGATLFASGIIRSNTSGTTFAQYQYSSSSMGTITTDGVNISYNATNAYLFGAGGSERMRITSGGNVGIGSTSPNIGVWNRALTLNTASGNAAYELAVGGSAQLYLAVDNSNAYLQVANATSPLRVFTGGSERMRITSAGNVGIGTTNPNIIIGSVSTLSLGGTNATISGGISYQVNGTAKMYHYVDTDGLFLHLGLSGVGQKFFTNSTEAMRITSAGNVGIGTTSPNYQLTVGTPGTTTDAFIQLGSATTGTGNIYFGDATGTGTASYAGFIRYSHSADQMLFGTSSANAMSINSLGSVGIGTTSVDASAIVQITSTTKGFLPPVMTGAQAEAISATPAAGLLVYANNGNGTVITSIGWWGYDGTTWVKLN